VTTPAVPLTEPNLGPPVDTVPVDLELWAEQRAALLADGYSYTEIAAARPGRRDPGVTAAARRVRRDVGEGVGGFDELGFWHDPSTGKFAPKGYISARILRALFKGDGKARTEFLGLLDKRAHDDPDFGRGLWRENGGRWSELVLGPRPDRSGDDRNVWDAAQRELANWHARNIDRLTAPAADTPAAARSLEAAMKAPTRDDLTPEELAAFEDITKLLPGFDPNASWGEPGAEAERFSLFAWTRRLLSDVMKSEDPQPEQVQGLKTMHRLWAERAPETVTLSRGSDSKDPFGGNDPGRYGSPGRKGDTATSGLTSWSTLPAEKNRNRDNPGSPKKWGRNDTTRDFPIDQVLGKGGADKDEVIVVRDPKIIDAIEAWPEPIDGVPTAPFNTFPERHAAAMTARAELPAVTEPPTLAGRRLADVPKLDGPADDALTVSEDPAFIRSLFEHDLGDDTRSVVDDIEPGAIGGNTTVRGRIEVEGQTVGTFTRYVRSRHFDYGEAVVVHDQFVLDKDQQGNGIGTRFLAASLDAYRSAGVDRVVMNATSSAGGGDLNGAYTWAKAGFDWGLNPDWFAPGGKQDLNHIESNLRSVGDDVMADRMAEVTRKLVAGEPLTDTDLTPYEVAVAHREVLTAEAGDEQSVHFWAVLHIRPDTAESPAPRTDTGMQPLATPWEAATGEATRVRRDGAGKFTVLTASGKTLGSYGGRAGARWASTADGTEITSDSPVSVGVLRGLIERAALDAQTADTARPLGDVLAAAGADRSTWDASVKDRLAPVFTADLGDGYTATPSVRLARDHSIDVTGEITHNGDKVGIYTYRLSLDEDGSPVAHLASMELEGAHTGKGVGTRLAAHIEDGLAAQGVQRLSVTAVSEPARPGHTRMTGALAWADAGFDWASVASGHQIGNLLLERDPDNELGRQLVAVGDGKSIAEMVRMKAPDGYPTPYEVARDPVGREVLLGSASWAGAKSLTGDVLDAPTVDLPTSVKDRVRASDGPTLAIARDNYLSRLGVQKGDAVAVEYQDDTYATVTLDNGERFKVKWGRFSDAEPGPGTRVVSAPSRTPNTTRTTTGAGAATRDRIRDAGGTGEAVVADNYLNRHGYPQGSTVPVEYVDDTYARIPRDDQPALKVKWSRFADTAPDGAAPDPEPQGPTPSAAASFTDVSAARQALFSAVGDLDPADVARYWRDVDAAAVKRRLDGPTSYAMADITQPDDPQRAVAAFLRSNATTANATQGGGVTVGNVDVQWPAYEIGSVGGRAIYTTTPINGVKPVTLNWGNVHGTLNDTDGVPTFLWANPPLDADTTARVPLPDDIDARIDALIPDIANGLDLVTEAERGSGIKAALRTITRKPSVMFDASDPEARKFLPEGTALRSANGNEAVVDLDGVWHRRAAYGSSASEPVVEPTGMWRVTTWPPGAQPLTVSVNVRDHTVGWSPFPYGFMNSTLPVSDEDHIVLPVTDPRVSRLLAVADAAAGAADADRVVLSLRSGRGATISGREDNLVQALMTRSRDTIRDLRSGSNDDTVAARWVGGHFVADPDGDVSLPARDIVYAEPNGDGGTDLWTSISTADELGVIPDPDYTVALDETRPWEERVAALAAARQTVLDGLPADHASWFSRPESQEPGDGELLDRIESDNLTPDERTSVRNLDRVEEFGAALTAVVDARFTALFPDYGEGDESPTPIRAAIVNTVLNGVGNPTPETDPADVAAVTERLGWLRNTDINDFSTWKTYDGYEVYAYFDPDTGQPNGLSARIPTGGIASKVAIHVSKGGQVKMTWSYPTTGVSERTGEVYRRTESTTVILDGNGADILKTIARRRRAAELEGASEVPDITRAWVDTMEALGIPMGVDAHAVFAASGKYPEDKPFARLGNNDVRRTAEAGLRIFPTSWSAIFRRVPQRLAIQGARGLGGGTHWNEGRTHKLSVPSVTKQPKYVDVVSHEFGHSFEDTLAGLTAAEAWHLIRRVAADPDRKKFRWTRQVSGRHPQGWKDEFADEYSGRLYKPSVGDGGNFEVFTTAVQQFSKSNRRHRESRTWLADPKLAAFAAGLMATITPTTPAGVDGNTTPIQGAPLPGTPTPVAPLPTPDVAASTAGAAAGTVAP